MHPGLVKLLFVLGDQLSHALLSAESKILLSEDTKISHVKFYATWKAGVPFIMPL